MYTCGRLPLPVSTSELRTVRCRAFWPDQALSSTKFDIWRRARDAFCLRVLSPCPRIEIIRIWPPLHKCYANRSFNYILYFISPLYLHPETEFGFIHYVFIFLPYLFTSQSIWFNFQSYSSINFWTIYWIQNKSNLIILWL